MSGAHFFLGLHIGRIIAVGQIDIEFIAVTPAYIRGYFILSIPLSSSKLWLNIPAPPYMLQAAKRKRGLSSSGDAADAAAGAILPRKVCARINILKAGLPVLEGEHALRAVGIGNDKPEIKLHK